MLILLFIPLRYAHRCGCHYFFFWRRKGNIVCVHTQTFSCFFNTFVINFDIGQKKDCVRTHNVCFTNLSHHYLLCMCLLSVRDAKDVYALLLSFGRDGDGVSCIAYLFELVIIGGHRSLCKEQGTNEWVDFLHTFFRNFF